MLSPKCFAMRGIQLRQFGARLLEKCLLYVEPGKIRRSCVGSSFCRGKRTESALSLHVVAVASRLCGFCCLGKRGAYFVSSAFSAVASTPCVSSLIKSTTGCSSFCRKPRHALKCVGQDSSGFETGASCCYSCRRHGAEVFSCGILLHGIGGLGKEGSFSGIDTHSWGFRDRFFGSEVDDTGNHKDGCVLLLLLLLLLLFFFGGVDPVFITPLDSSSAHDTSQASLGCSKPNFASRSSIASAATQRRLVAI